MGHVALEIDIPSPRDPRDCVQFDERAHERLGVAGKRHRAQIAGGLVLLADRGPALTERLVRRPATRGMPGKRETAPDIAAAV